jgi:hypothetical protein
MRSKISKNGTSLSFRTIVLLICAHSVLGGRSDPVKDQEEAGFRAQGQSSRRNQRCHRQIHHRLCLYLRQHEESEAQGPQGQAQVH